MPSHRLKAFALVSVLVAFGCDAGVETALEPPPQQELAAEATSRVPDQWQFDPPLEAVVRHQCHPPSDIPIDSLPKGPAVFEIEVEIAENGSVTKAKIISAQPSDMQGSALERMALDCVSSVVFEPPPYQPYRLPFTVRFAPPSINHLRGS